MDWDCALMEERLSDALAHTLLPEENAALQSHLVGCERCRQLLARVGGIVVELHKLPLVEEPPFLTSRIIAVTRGTPPRESISRRWFAGSSRNWQTRLVMGLVTIAATVLIVFHAVSAGAPGKLQFSPASLYRGVNRRVHLTYARGVKFVNDLRVVYEIQSRLSSRPEPVSEPTLEERRPDSDVLPKPPTDSASYRAVSSFAGLAVLMFQDRPQNAFHQTSRSLP
jgi:anti-sigma factor RsiW